MDKFPLGSPAISDTFIDPYEPSFVPVYRRRDLLASGVSDVEISHRLRHGQLTRLRHGVYADWPALTQANAAGAHLAHVQAAVLASTEPAFAFGPSAALLHGMALPWPAPPDVHIVRESDQDPRSLRRISRHNLTLPSMRITTHRDASLDAREVRGIAVVSPAIAAITSAHHVSFTRRVAMFDVALWPGDITAEEIADIAREWQHLGGLSVVLDALTYARRGAQSYLETLSRLALVRQGLPEPELQVPMYDADGLIGYADMYWPTLNVVGEADGAIKYGNYQALVKEKRREDRIRSTGIRVVRWMFDDIVNRADAVAASIRRASRWAA